MTSVFILQMKNSFSDMEEEHILYRMECNIEQHLKEDQQGSQQNCSLTMLYYPQRHSNGGTFFNLTNKRKIEDGTSL